MRGAGDMKTHPILFSGPMVRALLDGRKTQTRRLMKPPYGIFELVGGEMKPLHTRVNPGDLLWVREAWTTGAHLDQTKPVQIPTTQSIGYPADEDGPWWGRLRPSIHMPRWASRITLKVTDVRVQRLQNISEEDARAEGIEVMRSGPVVGYFIDSSDVAHESARSAFHTLWDSLNAKRWDGAGSWARNPWLVAYSFEVIHSNVEGLNLDGVKLGKLEGTLKYNTESTT